MLEYLPNKKCKIDKEGCLFVKRKNSFKEQDCVHEALENCRDTCPLFFESKGLVATSNKGNIVVERDMIILGCSFGPQIAYEIELDERE